MKHQVCQEQEIIVGRAFTEWKCAECERIQMHPDTGVPKVCLECSEKLWLCELCGEGCITKKLSVSPTTNPIEVKG